MNEENINVEEKMFYEAVAELLGCTDHQYLPYPFSRRTRWNGRLSGNGRYIGHGIVKRFSSTNVVLQLYNPKISGLFTEILH